MSSSKIDTDQFSALFTGEMARSYIDRGGGCTVELAHHLLRLAGKQLSPDPNPLRILDNACGPLVLTTLLLEHDAFIAHKPLHVSAVDISPDFIEANQATIDATPGWNDTSSSNSQTNAIKVDTAVMNGMDLTFPDQTFDFSFTSLAIFAFPDPHKGATELYRTTKPGGTAVLTTWKHLPWIDWFHEAERRIKKASSLTPFPMLEAWSGKGKLEGVMRDAGFKDVREGEARVQAWFASVEDMAGRLRDTLVLMVS